jgi:hypothetical protein
MATFKHVSFVGDTTDIAPFHDEEIYKVSHHSYYSIRIYPDGYMKLFPGTFYVVGAIISTSLICQDVVTYLLYNMTSGQVIYVEEDGARALYEKAGAEYHTTFFLGFTTPGLDTGSRKFSPSEIRIL